MAGERLPLDARVVRRGDEHGQGPAVAVDELEVAADAGQAGVGAERLDLPGEAVGQRDVVAVHPRQKLAAGLPERLVERLASAPCSSRTVTLTRESRAA